MISSRRRIIKSTNVTVTRISYRSIRDSQVIADQKFELSIFSLASLGDALLHDSRTAVTVQCRSCPLSAASELDAAASEWAAAERRRPQNESQNILRMKFPQRPPTRAGPEAQAVTRS